MNIDDKALPWISDINRKSIVYDYYTNDIVKLVYKKNNNGHIPSSPYLVTDTFICMCENYDIINIKKATDYEKEYFFNNLENIKVNENTLVEILRNIPDEEFKTIDRWLEHFKHFTKYFIYFDYSRNIHNKNNYHLTKSITHSDEDYANPKYLRRSDNMKFYVSKDNYIKDLELSSKKMSSVEYSKHFDKLNRIHISYGGERFGYKFEKSAWVYDKTYENYEYRYFVLFKKFLIENSKLPKTLLTVVIPQEEYDKLKMLAEHQDLDLL